MKWALAGGLTVAAVLVVGTATAGVYRWVDDNGTVHYADTPTAHAKRQAISGAPADSSTAQARGQALQKQLDAYREKQQNAQTKKQKAADKRAQAAKRCGALREKLTATSHVRRVARHDADGKMTYLSGADLVAYRKTLKQRVLKTCEAAQK